MVIVAACRSLAVRRTDSLVGRVHRGADELERHRSATTPDNPGCQDCGDVTHSSTTLTADTAMPSCFSSREIATSTPRKASTRGLTTV